MRTARIAVRVALAVGVHEVTLLLRGAPVDVRLSRPGPGPPPARRAVAAVEETRLRVAFRVALAVAEDAVAGGGGVALRERLQAERAVAAVVAARGVRALLLRAHEQSSIYLEMM